MHVSCMMQLNSRVMWRSLLPPQAKKRMYKCRANIWICSIEPARRRGRLVLLVYDKHTYYWNIIQETNLHVCFSFLARFHTRFHYHQTCKLCRSKCSNILVRSRFTPCIHAFLVGIYTSRKSVPRMHEPTIDSKCFVANETVHFHIKMHSSEFTEWLHDCGECMRIKWILFHVSQYNLT